jgi:hypothetical protein
LSLWDEIDIKKGGAEAPVGSVAFRHFAKEVQDGEKRKQQKPQEETALAMINCCNGERLGATMGFEHQKDKDKPKSALHAIIIENAAVGTYDTRSCPRKRVIVVRYCYPTYDDEGTRGWTCGEDKNTHGGDVHAQS